MAREMFSRGERIDMQVLAAQLGVSRATLYRWTGDRERLLADVLWANADALFTWTETFPGSGRDLIVARAEGFMRVIGSDPALRAFLQTERDLALRILTRQGIGVQDRSHARVLEELEQLRDTGEYEPRLPIDLLALAMVRLIQGFIYGDLIAGEEPDLTGAAEVIRALL
jgi:AcrR family transcriptional regulator